MSNKIENFIQENKNTMDTLQPSDKLWSSIETGIHPKISIATKSALFKTIGVIAGITIAASVLYYLTTDKRLIDREPVQTEKENKQVNSIEKLEEEETTVPVQKKNDPGKTHLKENPEKILPSETHESQPEGKEEIVTATISPEPHDPVVNVFSGYKKEEIRTEKKDTIFEGITSLIVNVSSANIKVKAVPGNKVHLKADLSAEKKGVVIGKEKHKFKIERNNSELTITVANESKHLVLGGTVTSKGILDFEVPENILLSINSNYGNISIEGIKGKTCNLTAGSGNINANDISGEIRFVLSYGNLAVHKLFGNMNVSATSGDVYVDQLQGDLNATLSYGKLTLKNIAGKIHANTTSGDVNIMEAKCETEIIAGYGNIHYENFKGNINLIANSGNVTGKNVQLLNSMSVKSSYGNINMELVNPLNDLSFDLKANYGKIKIEKDGNKMEESKSLLINKGNILIKCITNSGDQIYR